ncbi:GDSL-type esterase/lipase family protein [Pectinatus brassicae]|uniref:Lysophospholipase L1-like esterase n=1 Tax=Pectinatus brassicae TaxID=862415 RepID=A0A840UJ21_9FIRM|nr:GDSL-type esterase/lipase family protein [Pectinatus brassicae]MBB5337126.1 lysophospholipase L1-like esterase [Pectinatus brassicae]
MEKNFSKNKMYLFIIFLLALASIFSMHNNWKKTQKKFNSYVNDIGRGPDTPAYLSLHYRLRRLYFMLEPRAASPIVFLGDSMTDEGDWSKLFPQQSVVNRGIGGDTTLGVLQRLDQVIELNPPKIFLMIGTNDLCYNRSINDTLENYDRILFLLHKHLPHTKIYVESVLPFNDTIFPSVYLRTNKNIKLLNIGIKKLAAKYNYPYLDITAPFTGSDGRLPASETIDGLHLNDKGYALWREELVKYVKTT